jgi:SAM-dependent methyltransferase
MYTNKLSNYQGDCAVLAGKYPKFSDYIKEFSRVQLGHGLDLGCGPGACNGKFFKYCSLDSCDAEQAVVDTVPPILNVFGNLLYEAGFVYVLGQDILPYDTNELDFVVLSCVIQHLGSYYELAFGLGDVCRVLKSGGQLFLMFKSGSNDTLLTHYNSYYGEERTFRVFHPNNVSDLVQTIGFNVLSCEHFLDDNFIPYCCMVLEK